MFNSLTNRLLCGGVAGTLSLVVVGTLLLLAGAVKWVFPLLTYQFWLGALTPVVIYLLVKFGGSIFRWVIDGGILRFVKEFWEAFTQVFKGIATGIKLLATYNRRKRVRNYYAAFKLSKRVASGYVPPQPLTFQQSSAKKARSFWSAVKKIMSELREDAAARKAVALSLLHIASWIALVVTFYGVEVTKFNGDMDIIGIFGSIILVFVMTIITVKGITYIWNVLDDRWFPTEDERFYAALGVSHIPLWAMAGAAAYGGTLAVVAWSACTGYVLAAAILGLRYQCSEGSLLSKLKS